MLGGTGEDHFRAVGERYSANVSFGKSGFHRRSKRGALDELFARSEKTLTVDLLQRTPDR
jgi:hypothetical protein